MTSQLFRNGLPHELEVPSIGESELPDAKVAAELASSRDQIPHFMDRYMDPDDAKARINDTVIES